MKKKFKKGLIVTSAVSASLFNTPALITDAMAQAAESSNVSDVTADPNTNNSTDDGNNQNPTDNGNNDATNENGSNTNNEVNNSNEETDNSSKVSQDSSIGPGYYDKATTKARSLMSSFNTAVPASTSNFINSVANGAINGWKKYKVLPSVTIAQAILESAWGGSALTTKANNLFGIKGRYNGQYVTMPTWEVINGQNVMVNAEFRKYPSRDASMEDHGNFLTVNSRYKNLLGVTDYKKVTRLLQQDGYATDPAYPEKLNSIIETYGLTKYDKQATNVNKKVITINYVPGYSINVWNSSSSNREFTGKKLKHGTSWKYVASVKGYNGHIWYNLGGNQWIDGQYAENVSSEGNVQVNYVPGYSINVWNSANSNREFTGKKLKHGTSWKFVGTMEGYNGHTWYNLGGNQWVDGQYVENKSVSGNVQVNYVSGYSISVWNGTTSSREFTGKKLRHGTSWKFVGTMEGYNGHTWYNLGGNQWIDGQYAEDITNPGVAKVNYIPGYSINVWSNPTSNREFTGKKLKHGTSWKYRGTMKGYNGSIWYNLGGNQWVDGQYIEIS